MRLKNQVAIVTGGGAGIGRGIALKLAREGCNVVIAEINEKTGEKVAKEIKDLGKDALAVRVDVSSKKDTEEMAARTLSRFGKIDSLICNAGIHGKYGTFLEIDEAAWDSVVAIHLKGTFLCCRAVVPQMIKQKSGCIINTSSVGVKLNKGNINYIASKAGIETITKTLAIELGPHNIRVNCVAPGFIETQMWEDFGGLKGDFATNMDQFIPLGKRGNPEMISGAIAFLLSDDADYITGSIIPINGGLAV